MASIGLHGKRWALLALGIVSIIALVIVFTRGAINWDDAATNLLVIGLATVLATTVALMCGSHGRED